MTEPFYADETVTLYRGDMREVLPVLGIEPDCVIADPPYGETALAWDRWPDGWPAVVADYATSMWCFGSMRMFLDRRDELVPYWRLSHDVVWEKQNATGPQADRFRRLHEYALHWYRGGWNLIHHDPQREQTGVVERGRLVRQGRKNAAHLGEYREGGWVDDGTRLMTSVLRVRNRHRDGGIHPTEKPLRLLDPLIRYACPPGGVVLDPFAGSGSTAAAARLSGRRAVLIEARADYCDAIARRLSQDVLPIGEVV